MANIILWNSYSDPEHAVRPLGSHCLAQWLTHNGYTAHVIDFCNSLSTEQLSEITEKHITSDTVAVGVSTTFWQPMSTFVAHDKNFDPTRIKYHEPNWVISARQRLESKFPKLKWLLGGPNVHTQGKRSMFNWISFFGNAEDQLLKFVSEQLGTKKVLDLFNINTATCRYIDKLSIQPQERITTELGRGCQFKCRFCSYPLIGKKKGTYLRSKENIEADFIENYEKYGVANYAFMDDTLNESTEKIEDLAEMSQRLPFRLQWIGYNRLDLIGTHPETIELLETSGLRGSFFGIESFHPEASKAVGKGWNGKHGKEFLLQLMEIWRNKVNLTLNMIAGLPGESPQYVEETHQWCIDNDIHAWLFAPLWISRTATDGSEFSRNYSNYGYRFPKPLNNTYWESDLWTRDSAVELAKKLNTDPRRLEKVVVNCWNIPRYLALGYSFDELLTMTERTIKRNNNISEAHTRFIDNYVQDQLK